MGTCAKTLRDTTVTFNNVEVTRVFCMSICSRIDFKFYFDQTRKAYILLNMFTLK